MGVFPVRRLTCPKCQGQFDYEFVPGGSFTAIRLGNSRYMRCPLCHRFAVFRLTGPDTVVPSASEASDRSRSVGPPPERSS